MWLTHVGEQEQIRTLLHQPSQQRTSRLQSDFRLLLQEILEGSRQSVHGLDSTFDLSVALALALRRCFGHNLAMPAMF